TERVYPPLDAFSGPGGRDREMDWVKNHDYQVRRNLAVYPRAWVVHSARYIKPITGLSRVDREAPMLEILYSNDPFWKDPTRTVYDTRAVAWLDQADQAALAPFLTGTLGSPSEAVTVVRYEPDCVVLDAVLETPGLVV